MVGVSPRVAQAAMRHSSIDLTMNVYTDPRLLDVQGAVESLPQISVTSEPNENRQRIAAGAEDFLLSSVAVPTDFSKDLQSTPVTFAEFSSAMSESPEMQKTPRKPVFLGVSTSEAGGTRTRNLRIDSPAL